MPATAASRPEYVTEDEFRIARQLTNAKDTDPVLGENMYQVCRAFRGQIFQRALADAGLAYIRRNAP